MLGNKDMTSKQTAEAKMNDVLFAYDDFKTLVNDINVHTIS